MSSERVTMTTPHTDRIDGEELNREAEQLAADLQRLRDLIEHDRVGAARAFVKELEARWPDSERVQHYARVLAPPVSRSRPDLPARSRDREMKWLKEHGHEYPGCWLAIYEDRLIAADPDHSVVVAKAREVLGKEGALLFHQPEAMDL